MGLVSWVCAVAFVEHHPWVSWQQKNSSSQETDMADTERSDKELRDRGIRDIVGGCDAGDANRSVALCAKPGCVETLRVSAKNQKLV